MTVNLDECHRVAVKAAKHVGSIIKSRIWTEKSKVDTKSSAIDFVTDTDQEVEEYLQSTLRRHFPKHLFVGEESAVEEKINLTLAPTWIIDPVDGTMNFVHGYPNVCISIALYVKKVAEIGIIYNPVTEYFFSARRGQGAHLNGKPISVSKTTELANTLLSFEFGTSVEPEKITNCMQNVSNILPKVQGSLGSAAMNMAMVALGASDAYFEFGLHAWDMAAGELIIREAGGVVIDPSGGEFDLLSRKVLCASTMTLAKKLSLEIIQFPIPNEGVLISPSQRQSSDTRAL